VKAGDQLQLLDAIDAHDLTLARKRMKQHFETGRQRLEGVEKEQSSTPSYDA